MGIENKVILIGRLTADIELKRNNDGNAFVFFTLAVNDRAKGEATFIPCSAFNKTAELMEQYVGKGSQVGVEGSINIFGGKKQDDGSYSATRTTVNVNSITFLGDKSDRQQAPQSTFTQETPMTIERQPSSFDNNNQEEINANNINLQEIKF